MKNAWTKIISTACLLLLCFCVQAAEKRDDKNNREAFAQMVALVESNLFYIELTDAFPTGNSSVNIKTKYGTRTLGGEGHISLIGNRGEIVMLDSVAVGRLPFFGRGYTLPYGGDGGIEFNRDKITGRSVKVVNKRKKQYLEYKFSVPVRNDTFNIYMEIYANGTCTMNVTSNNRASISYSGTVTSIPEDKAKIYLK